MGSAAGTIGQCRPKNPKHVNKVDLVSQGAEMSAIPLAIILDGIALLSFSNSSSISMALSPILTQVGISA